MAPSHLILFTWLPLLSLVLGLTFAVDGAANETHGADDVHTAVNSSASLNGTQGTQGQHNETVPGKEEKKEKDSKDKLGLWAIEDPSVVFDPHLHHHAPYCLLLQMNASLVIPAKEWSKVNRTARGRSSTSLEEQDDVDEYDYADLDLLDGDDGAVVKNKTITIPSSAVATGTCSDTQQTITLSWNNTAQDGNIVKTGHIVFIFEKVENNYTTLAGVFSTISLFLDESGAQNVIDDGATTQHLDMKVKDVNLWLTPNRFAFVCRSRLEIRLAASTNPVQGGTDGDILIVDPIENDEAFLVLDFIRVQAFRNNGFAKHFTHLQYDCTRNWPYDYVPYAVGTALLALVIVNCIAFALRKKMGCTPSLDDEQQNAAESSTSTAVSLDNDDEQNTTASIEDDNKP